MWDDKTIMKFGFRFPSFRKRVSARLSPARFVRHSMGAKAPRGWGWFTNPKKALTNRIYQQTTFGIQDVTRVRRRSDRKIWWLLLFVLLGLAWRAFAQDTGSWQSHRYSVIRVTDGDTFTATDGNINFKVRIAGMDAPEKAQSYGKVATSALSSLIMGKQIAIKTVGNGLDQYGRVLGIVYVEGKDVAQEIIQQGLATYYRPRCRDYPDDKDKYNYDPRAYISAEVSARAKKMNFWSAANDVLPCRFRQLHR